MHSVSEIVHDVVDAFQNGRYFQDVHADIRQNERGITDDHLVEAVGYDVPEIINNRPPRDDDDVPAFLIRGVAKNRVLHVWCRIEEPLYSATCYEPDPTIWLPGFRAKRGNQ